MTQWPPRCSRPPHCAPSPASVTPSSPAKAACPTGSMRVSTAGAAPAARPPDEAGNARARRAAALGVAPDPLLPAYQVHAPDVVTIERRWRPHERPRADAIVTAVPGLAIGVTTADCGPVLFADETAGVIAVAHAGWRG